MPKLDYGNWVPMRFIYGSFVVGLLFLVSALWFVFLVIPAALLFFVAAFFAYARYMFSSAVTLPKIFLNFLDLLILSKSRAISSGFSLFGSGVLTNPAKSKKLRDVP